MTDFTKVDTIYRRGLRTVTVKLTTDYVAETHVELQTVSNPDEVFNVLRGIFSGLDDDQEHLVMLVLNVANRVTGFKLISSGGQDSSVGDPKIIFRNALLLGARSIVIAHNHPSGNPKSSAPDRQFTRQIAAGGKLLDIPLLDHLILAGGAFTSLKQEHEELFLV